MRRLDPHVHARLGQNVIRQYNVPEQLAVSILLDTSESMSFGEPKKSLVALGVTAGLALCAVTGSDTVRCGAIGGDRVEWYPRLGSEGRIDELEAWLLARQFGGRADLFSALTAAVSELPRLGLLIVISDMWIDNVPALMDLLTDAGQAIVVVRILAPEEANPARYIGEVRIF